ncbi:MAG: hypothetical protein ACE5IK_00865 [Acidobacteriota bacterium]
MRRFFKISGGLILVLAMGTGLSSATLLELVAGNLDFGSGGVASPFSCPALSLQCHAFFRVYGDLDPRLTNQAADPTAVSADGYPNFGKKKGRWVGDTFNTGNYTAISNNTDACEAWYGIWVAELNAETPDYQSYYAASSTIVNFSEVGSKNFADCVGTNELQIACLGENGSAVNSFANTPIGAVTPVGNGWEPVPIPEITNSSVAAGTVDLAWPAVANANTPNRPGATGVACPFNATFNDLTATSGPNPIWGVRLFVYKVVAGAGNSRSLASLEGGSVDAATTLFDIMQNGQSDRMACTGASDCPGVHAVNCVAGATSSCQGTDFSPAAQAFQLTAADVNAALGADGPLGSSEAVVFVTKVLFRGSVPGSNTNTRTVTFTNPGVVSLFSTNSQQVSFSALVASASFGQIRMRGTRFVELGWTTVGDIRSMTLQRSFDGVTFSDVANIPATPGQDTYTFTDNLTRTRGRTPAQITYRLLYETATGSGQTFGVVSTSPRGRRTRR